MVDEADIRIGFSYLNDTQYGLHYVWAGQAMASFKTRIKSREDISKFVKQFKNLDNTDLLDTVRAKCTEPFCTSETKAKKLVCCYIWMLK